MKRSVFLVFIVLSTSLSGCLEPNDHQVAESQASQQIIDEMELEISNLSSQLDEANNTILELQALQSQLNDISLQLDEANKTILDLQLMLLTHYTYYVFVLLLLLRSTFLCILRHPTFHFFE